MTKNLLPLSLVVFSALLSCESKQADTISVAAATETIVVDSIIRDTIVQQDTVLIQKPSVAIDKAVMITNAAYERFYVGIDNIVKLKTVGVNADKVSLTALNPSTIIEINKDKSYTVRFSKKGSTYLLANYEGGTDKFPFEVEKLPTPHVNLAGKFGGVMTANMLKSQKGLSAGLDYIKDAAFAITGYELIYYSEGVVAEKAKNNEAAFNSATTRLISKAKTGDLYVFHKVQVLCPGDTESRPSNGITVIVQ